MNTRKKGISKRLLALLCAITLVLGSLPARLQSVYALDEEDSGSGDASGFSVSLSPSGEVAVGTEIQASLNNAWSDSGTEGDYNFTVETEYAWTLTKGDGTTSTGADSSYTPDAAGELELTVTQTKTYTAVETSGGESDSGSSESSGADSGSSESSGADSGSSESSGADSGSSESSSADSGSSESSGADGSGAENSNAESSSSESSTVYSDPVSSSSDSGSTEAVPEDVTQTATASVTVNKGTLSLSVELDQSDTDYASDLTVTATPAATYNGNAVSDLTYSYAWTKDDASDVVSTDATLNVGENGAGTYTVKVTSEETEDTYYSASAEATIVISKATPEVSVSQINGSVQYDSPVEFEVESNAVGSITIANEDSVVLVLDSVSGKYKATVDYGTQDVTNGSIVSWSFASDDENYNDKAGTVTYIVTSGSTDASVSVSNTSPEYGEGIELAEDYGGFENGEFTYTVTVDESTFSKSKEEIESESKTWNSGTYTIGWNFSANDTNYEGKGGTINVVVEKKGIEITVDATKEYDATNELDTDDELTITAGEVSDLTISLKEPLTDDSFVNVTDAETVVVFSYDNYADAEGYFGVRDTDGASNYYVKKATVNVTVTAVVISEISVTLSSKTYDGTTVIEAESYTLEGVLSVDESSVSVEGLQFNTYSGNAGDYAGANTDSVDSSSTDIVIVTETSEGSMVLSGNASANYTLGELTYNDVVTNDVTISPIEVTVKQSDENFEIDSDEVISGGTGATYTPATTSDYYTLELTNSSDSFPNGESPVVKPVDNLNWTVAANRSGYYLGSAMLTSGGVDDFAVYDSDDAAEATGNYSITAVEDFAVTIRGLETDETSYALDEGANKVTASDSTLVTFDLGSKAADNRTYWYGTENSSLTFAEDVILYTWDGTSDNAPSKIGSSGTYSLVAATTDQQTVSDLYVQTSDGVFYGPFSITYLYDGAAPTLKELEVVVTSLSEAGQGSSGTLDYGDSTDADSIYLQYTITVYDAENASGLKSVSWAVSKEQVDAANYGNLDWKAESFIKGSNSATFDVTVGGSGYLYVRAEDYAGNVSYLYGGRALVAETSAPETPDVKISDDGLYKNNHTVKIEANDNKDGDYSGIWKVDWYLLKGDYTTAADVDNAVLSSAVNSSVDENTNDVPENYAGLSVVKSLTVHITLGKDSSGEDLEGQYTLYVVATDFCGNTSQIAKLVYFDNSAPTASVTMTGGAYYTDDQQYYYKADNCGIEVVIYDYPYVNDQSNVVSYKITLSNEDVDIDDVVKIVKTGEVTISGNDDGAIVSESVSLTPAEVACIKDGKISITVSLEDSAGSSENATTSFNSDDDTNPSGGVNLEDVSAPVFILDMTAPKLDSVTDSTDGNYISEDSAIYYNSNFSTYFEISDDNLDFENKLYESSGDENDKRTILTAESQTEGTQLAVIEGAAADDEDNVYEVKLTTGDESIASESYTYSLYIADRAGNVLTLNLDSGASDPADDDTGFAYEVKDGTVTLLDSRVIDNETPTLVSVSDSQTDGSVTGNYISDDEAIYYNQEFTTYFVVEDSNYYDHSGYVEVKAELDGEDDSLASLVTVQTPDTSDQSAILITLTPNGNVENNHYAISLYVMDKAGNVLVAGDTAEDENGFAYQISDGTATLTAYRVVDNVAPVLTEVVDDTDNETTGLYYKDDNAIYYNKEFTTTFTVTEVNYSNNIDDTLLQYVNVAAEHVDGTGNSTFAADYGEDSTSSGLDTVDITLKLTPVNDPKSESYQYTLRVVDKAGNVLVAGDTADDENGYAYQVSDGTATLTADRVIDTVAPVATITYSATNNENDCYDGDTAYYNLDIKAAYAFSDSNLDLSEVFTGYTKDGDQAGQYLAISEIGENSTNEAGKVTVKVEADPENNGRIYTIIADTVDYNPTGHDNDGSYNFQAYGKDKAGNALVVKAAENGADEPVFYNTSGCDSEENAFTGKTKIMDTIQPQVIIDYTDLEATHYYTESDGNVYAYYKSSFDVVYTFTDANILNVEYLKLGYTYDHSYSSVIEPSVMTGDKTTEVVGSYTVSSGDGLWKFTVTGKDYAGNPLYIIENDVDGNGGTNPSDSEEQTTVYKGEGKVLDTVAPTLTIDYTDLDNSHYYTESDGVYAYYNSELTTTYTFYDRSGLDQSKLIVGYQFTPDSTVSSASSVNSMAKLSEGIVSAGLYDTQSASTNWTVAAESDNNGSYNYKVYGEDKAGNALIVTELKYESNEGESPEDKEGHASAEAPYVGQTKVMDTVSPVYTSTFTDVDADNAGAVDEDDNYTAYYNTDISVYFTIEDTNLDNGLITTGVSYLTSSDYSTADPEWVSISGNAEKSTEYSTTYKTEEMNFSQGDGVYRFEVYARDKAGNLLVQSTESTEESVSEKEKTAQYQTEAGGDGEGSWWTLRKVYDTVAPTLDFTMWVGSTTIFESSFTDVISGQATVEGALAVTVNRPYQSSSTATANISTLDTSPTTFEYVFRTTAADGSLSNSNTETYYADSGSSTTGWQASNGEYNNSNDISFSGQQTVELTTLKVKDRAGNELIITVPSSLSGDSVINKIYLDVTPPSGDYVGSEITLSYGSSVSTVLDNGRGPSGNPLYGDTVTVTAHVQDPYGDAGTQYASTGLYRVYYEVLVNGTAVDASLVNASGNGTTIANGTTGYLEYNTSGATADFGSEQKNETLTYDDVITFTFNPSGGVFNNNNIEIRVWAEDNSGNGGSVYSENSSRNSYSFGIDITSPQIQVTYDNNDVQNEKYFKADRTATIVVTERNFDPDTTTITTEDAAVISGWTYTAGSLANGDDDTWTATVTYNVDGDYTFDVTTTDRVGLTESAVDYADSAAPQEFTIDKTTPVITVVFDNNDVQNGRYYNDTRLATISIDEHNFAAGDVVVTTTAEIAEGSVSVPGTSSWSSTGDMNSATVNFAEDGDYTMTVTYTDLAGNEAEAVVIALFTVDTTAPTLEIGGVEDYMAYNGDVAPSITYHDINYDSSSAYVSITGYNHPTGSNLTGTRSEDSFGGSYVCDNIEATRENDDVYVLTGYVSDLAGNTSEASITFSVNRFGSTYILSVSTQEVVDGYYTAVSPVVEVTEINVNELTSYQVSTSMNGEVTTLTDNTDYSVESSNPGWWQYVYTIDAANYDAEGTYTTTLLSQDAATNSNSNRAIKQDGGTTNELSIEFTVDKTAPTLIISGVEQDEQYIDTDRTIMVYYDDNIAVTHVTFYVNDEVVAEYYNTEDNYVLSASGELSYVATAQNRWQTFTVVATDEVGNVSAETSVRFLLTDNLFVQWFNNTPLFIGSIIAILLLFGLIFFILFKRRKKEDEQQNQG